MICENCSKDKADVMARMAPEGDAERQGKKFCTECCVNLWPRIREWMRASIPDEA